MANVLPLVPDASSHHFRRYRKLIHQVIGTKAAVSRFNPLLDVEIRRFALRILENPQQLRNHIRTKAGAAILKISHGYTIEPKKADPFVDLADRFLEEFSVAAMPGRWIVDVVPACEYDQYNRGYYERRLKTLSVKYLPRWLPGMEFKQIADNYKRTSIEITEKPLAFVKQQIVSSELLI